MCRLSNKANKNACFTCASNIVHLKAEWKKVGTEQISGHHTLDDNVRTSVSYSRPALSRRQDSFDSLVKKLPPIGTPGDDKFDKEDIWRETSKLPVIGKKIGRDIEMTKRKEDIDLPLGMSCSPIFHSSFDTTSFINTSIQLFKMNERCFQNDDDRSYRRKCMLSST